MIIIGFPGISFSDGLSVGGMPMFNTPAVSADEPDHILLESGDTLISEAGDRIEQE